jgi:ABC-type sugar transport system ATPase subunit
MRKGFAYLTEDRTLQGLAMGLTSSENLLSALNVSSNRLVPRRMARETFDRLAAHLQLHPPDPARPTSQFSGGNQQKILLAKWLAIAPQVCILDEPTRGVDVGAKRVIHEAIVRLADQGRSVVLISSDLPELVGLSDRILILRKGRLVREMHKDEFSEDAVLLAASGEG